MSRTVQESTAEYERFRQSYRLKQGTWREYDDRAGKTYACALGAFLHTDENGDNARAIGCAVSMMPRWLVDLTPDFFDCDYTHKKFYLKWADALYLPGGLIDRANQLEEADRKKVYAAAEKEIRRRLNCQLREAGATELGPYQPIESVLHVAKPGRDKFDCFFDNPDDRSWRAIDAEQSAGTIINVLDEVLKEKGV